MININIHAANANYISKPNLNIPEISYSHRSKISFSAKINLNYTFIQTYKWKNNSKKKEEGQNCSCYENFLCNKQKLHLVLVRIVARL